MSVRVVGQVSRTAARLIYRRYVVAVQDGLRWTDHSRRGHQDWARHGEQCDGSGGFSSTDALVESVETIVGRVETALALGGEDCSVWESPREESGLRARAVCSEGQTTRGMYADPVRGECRVFATMTVIC